MAERKKKEAARGRNVITVFIGLFLFGGFLALGGRESFYQLFQLSVYPFIGAYVATFGITACVALRWGILLNASAGRRVASWPEYYHYFIVSRVMGFVLPKDATDIAARSLFVKNSHNVGWILSGTSIVLDRILDLFIAVLFLLSVIPYWSGRVDALTSFCILILLIVAGALLLIFGHRGFLGFLERGINKCLALIRRFRPGQQRPDFRLLETAKFYPKAVLTAYFLSILKFGFTALRLVLFAKALNLAIAPLLILFAAPAGQFAYLFSFTPGGLGIFEAGWFGILRFGGVGLQDATLFVVGQRFLMIICVSAWAMTSQAFFMYQHRIKKCDGC